MTRFVRFFLFTFLLFSIFIAPLFSQEVQIPILPQKHIDYIDAHLQKKFDLFGEYSNFQEARIFQLPDSSYVLEILYRSKGKLFKDRKSITAQDIQELRQSLITRLQREQQKSTLDQNGRTKLLIASTLLSLGYYGWVVPEALNINNEKRGKILE